MSCKSECFRIPYAGGGGCRREEYSLFNSHCEHGARSCAKMRARGMWKYGLKTLPFWMPLLAAWVTGFQEGRINSERAHRAVELDQMDRAISESDDEAWEKFLVNGDRGKWTETHSECKSRRVKLERQRFVNESAANIQLASLISEVQSALFIGVGVGFVFYCFGPKQVSAGRVEGNSPHS